MSSVWHCLENIRGLMAASSIWRNQLGNDFDSFKAAFLRTRPQPAKSFPCPNECGCAHEVVENKDGSLVAICRCEPWNCDDIRLTAADVVLLELNWSKLGRAIAKAFGCEAMELRWDLPNTLQVAAFSNAAVPVVLTIQNERDEFRRVAAELSARLRQPFILLAPTAQFVDGKSKELLANCKAGFFSLESHVTMMSSGLLHSAKSGGELFATHLPEKQDTLKQTEATRIFELMRKLRSDSANQKAPPIDVFIFTVLEGLSQKETAKRCKCVPSLVSSRVKAIERTFNLTIEQLRNYASEIREMQSSVKGDKRAKKTDGAAYHVNESEEFDTEETEDDP